MEINSFEGIVHNVFLDIIKREYEIEVTIYNETYLLKLHGMDYNLISKLKSGNPIKFKGIMDKEKKEIRNAEDVWVRLV